MKTLSKWVEFNPRVELERGQEYPFVGMERLKPGSRYVESNEVRAFSGGGARFKFGDTLFARITPCLENGKIAQFAGPPDSCGFGSTEFFVFRARVGLADPSFIYYLSHTDLVRKTALNSMVGASGRQRADIAALRDLAIDLPEPDVQERIGGLLSRYDDLITANSAQMVLLEESVRLTFREWFVNLRFPGCSQGWYGEEIPEGWTRRPISQLLDVNPKTSFEKNRLYPFVPMQSLSETSMLIDTVEERVVQGGAKFQNSDTLLARITPCLENGKTGFVQFLTEDAPMASGSTEFIVLRGVLVSPYWVYCLAREDSFRKHVIGSMVGSDGRQRVNTKCFDSYYAFQPPPEIMNAFDEVVSPMFSQVENLAKMNRDLKICRDELLPRLMSGAIRV
jgi:type I restriction enzyme S subunit